MTNLPMIDDYIPLRDEILSILETGKERARLAVERERVISYWTVGRMIHEHVLRHEDRAGFGERVMARLAEDIGIGKRVLYRTVAFYRAFPIVSTQTQLSWSHYQQLSAIPEPARREAYYEAAETRGWSARELTAAIRTQVIERGMELEVPEETVAEAAPTGLTARMGALYNYRLLRKTTENSIRLDLGFGLRYSVHNTMFEDFNAACGTMMVESIRLEHSAYRYRAIPSDKTRLYTYAARVEDVIDGDTLRVDVDCGFGIGIRQKLRLRGIDTPEMGTAAGVRARNFVIRALSQVPVIVLATYRADKYDRYVADVLYRPGTEQPADVLPGGVYLNGLLLEEGLATIY